MKSSWTLIILTVGILGYKPNSVAPASKLNYLAVTGNPRVCDLRNWMFLHLWSYLCFCAYFCYFVSITVFSINKTWKLNHSLLLYWNSIFPQKRLYQRSVKSRINREDLNMLLAFTVERLKERVSTFVVHGVLSCHIFLMGGKWRWNEECVCVMYW